MSSSKRGSEYQNRWNLATIAPAKKKKKHTKPEQIKYMNRIIKRANKAAGYTTEKLKKTWSFFHTYFYQFSDGGRGGTVEGHTKSDARNEIKKKLGLPLNKPLLGLLKLEVKHDPNK